jgi:MinD-like ATPase involved in chromosome partitioning or flagellar assembly
MLVRQIRGLDVDDVMLDLGAGSAFNVLDFFLLARRGLVVVTPEPTAIENAEHFIRVAFYRSLREVVRRPDVAPVIRQLRENGRARRLHSAGELIALVRAIDPIAGKLLEEQAQAFAPLLIVNQVQAPEHRAIGPRLAASCRERLGAAVEFAGSIEAEPSVGAAVARGQPALQGFPLCRFSKHIEALAERLLREDPEFARERDRQGGRDSRRATPGVFADAAAPSRPLPPFDRAAPGTYLRQCRETLGLSLADMTERTRIRILDQIEDERFDLLPPEVYLKGYLFEYARELGVPDIADVAKCYLAKAPAPHVESAPPAPAPKRRFGGWRG